MHIPDGILSAPILAVCGTASAVSIVYSARKAEAATGADRIPLLGVLGAFVFAAQMVNFPVGPASGHLLGGALLAAAIGPWAASITMTAILLVQALVFQDGGLLALAANVFNMAVLGVWAAWLPYQWLSKLGHQRAGLMLGALLSVLVSAVAALAEVSVSSGIMSSGLWMFCIGLFSLTGMIEAAITIAAWEAIGKLEGKSAARREPDHRVLYVLLASVAVMLGGVFFASGAPDVLEYFQKQTGVATAAASFPALMPDYEWKSINVEWLRRAAAGIAGLFLVYALSLLVSRLMPRAQQ